VLAALALTANNSPAQPADRPTRPGRGNFDPEQMRQRMMEQTRERLGIKSDEEWKILQPRLEKVMEARRDAGGFGGFGRMMGPPPGRGPGGDVNAPDQARRRLGPPQNPEAEALMQAIEAKASTEELKAKMAKLREARKDREAKLAQAQEDLRKLLNVRQEAMLVATGMLP
jgi:hypothetical protein